MCHAWTCVFPKIHIQVVSGLSSLVCHYCGRNKFTVGHRVQLSKKRFVSQKEPPLRRHFGTYSQVLERFKSQLVAHRECV